MTSTIKYVEQLIGVINPIIGSSGDSEASESSSDNFVRIKSFEIDENSDDVPDMWSMPYIGLYSQYAAVGLLYGTSGTLLSLCVYVFNGQPNVCSNSSNITFFAWNFKIIFAIVTDSFRPFGMRRRPWMIAGWIGVLILLLVLAITADSLDVSSWISILMLIQCFAMLSDVPADGYCVELGQLEPPHRRGVILATAQTVRYVFSILAGFIQAVLLNGPTTNEPGCKISFADCWESGLSINGYYGLLLAIVFILSIPVLWLKEIDVKHKDLLNMHKHRDFKQFMHEIWLTLQNLTTLYLLIFVIGLHCLSNFRSNANVYMQYYVIKLTNFQAGLDIMSTYAALSLAVYIFQRNLINVNWRYTQIAAIVFSSILGLLWILVYYDIAGLRNPWFTIFIDLDTTFASGIAQVLYCLSVIELAKTGLEATTYELVITVANASLTVCAIIATQLLTPLNAAGCKSSTCPSNTVSIHDAASFEASNGPQRFTTYCILLIIISIISCVIFTQFLPKSKEQCHEWKKIGDEQGTNRIRGFIALFLCTVTVLYGFIVAILLINPSTACLPAVGGAGC